MGLLDKQVCSLSPYSIQFWSLSGLSAKGVGIKKDLSSDFFHWALIVKFILYF